LKENCTVAANKSIPANIPAPALPAYILERNEQALAAGLAIEKQDTCNGYLTTWYRGTEKQWRASPFCRRTKPFTTSGMGYNDFKIFSADTWAGLSLQYRKERDYRGSIPREILPTVTTDLGDGIIQYRMTQGHRDLLVYVGAPQAMIDRKIAPPEIMVQRKKVVNGSSGYLVTLWERKILPDGRYCFIDEVGAMQDVDAEGINRGKTKFTSPSQIPRRWATMATAVLHVLRAEYERAETADGRVFAVTKDSLEAIKELGDELIDAIRCAQVTTTCANVRSPSIEERVIEARIDPAFQSFMRDTGIGPAGQQQRK
jgi:hypothetical protein